MATEYSWKAGSRFPVRPTVAGKALESIRKRSGGELTPQAVVDAARDPDHPLHRCFLWDDTEAAERYRQAQARTLIYSVRVRTEGAGDRHLGYVNVKTTEGGNAYLPAAVVMSDEAMREQSLADCMKVLDGFRQRYEHLSELAGVWAAIDHAKAQTRAKRKAAAVS